MQDGNLPQVSPNENLTTKPRQPSYSKGKSRPNDAGDGDEADAMTPHPPKEADLPPPACLTDGSNSQIPREYISKWKVTDSNVAQRTKELQYTLNLLTNVAMDELVTNPTKYERDF